MAVYNFDQINERRSVYSEKWNVEAGELPMWIADMDFETAPEVLEALHKRVDNGTFGYTYVPEEWYDAYVSWWRRRYDFSIEREWLLFCPGVIAALSSIVRKLSTVGEKVVVLTPVYNIFFNSIINNGRFPIECQLKETEGVYDIDFAELEEKLSDPQVSLLIFCNPHNPVGRIWTREELAKVGELCARYHVIAISDEVHCDLTKPGKAYVPFASASRTCLEHSITLMAPSKSFNMAGLCSACILVENPLLRHRVWRGINTDEVGEPNAFAVQAVVAAYTKGESWLEELRKYLWNNRCYAEDYIRENIPKLKAIIGEATYLLWVDCRGCGMDGDTLAEELRRLTGLYVNGGGCYHGDGRGFIRINLACPRSILEDGMKRLKDGIGQLCR